MTLSSRCTAPVHDGAASALSAARDLAGLVTARAEQGEKDGAVPDDVVGALSDAGLLHLLVASELGGSGLEIDAFGEVAEEIGRADASTGWCYIANAVVTGLVAGHLDDEGASALFARDGRAVAAGMLTPRGTVTAVDGGLRVGGEYSFASGSRHAQWIGAAGLLASAERPTSRVFLLPRADVEFRGNWAVLGLRATHSVDYTVPPRFVRSAFTFDPASCRPARGQVSLRLGTVALSAAGHAAVALGTARRALEEIVRIVGAGKVRPPMPPLRDQSGFRTDFAELDGRYRAARARHHEVLRDAVAAAASPEPVPEVVTQRIRQTATITVDTCLHVVSRCFEWSGSTGLRDPHPLQRCLRDMYAQKQHVLVDANSLAPTAPALMEQLRTG
ncbi:acyl-CoA dehydrogenase family protein [Actinomycetospora termitidis]|uniref:Acyl-CoA dehydrogenase family protein n=1 Tax=Actinomycetospora termitidis TaxID=3053470 RepID=A0ABT7M5U0_9PSEU|nr:acyl-CoA dehydrogenase family protein [Actinomycetospora sp. Odt1-22]MDL5155624.1 acyl-CoA dehydrogenase family protein [Actinomycetospora sp. Odt1-22]